MPAAEPAMLLNGRTYCAGCHALEVTPYRSLRAIARGVTSIGVIVMGLACVTFLVGIFVMVVAGGVASITQEESSRRIQVGLGLLASSFPSAGLGALLVLAGESALALRDIAIRATDE
jgi:mannitol-specific phosphotransferase system IIBC component